MTRLGALIVVALGLAAGLGQRPAGAQAGGRLDLVAQTLFVDENPVEIVLRVSGAPAGAQLEFEIFRTPLLTRDELRQSHDNPPTSDSRLSFFRCPLEGECAQAIIAFEAGDLVTVTLLDEEIGEALRRDPGALPLVVRLIDDEGNEIDAFNTSLLVLAEEAADVRVAFVSDLHAPIALGPDQTLRLDVDALLSSTTALAARSDLPVTVEVRPETLDALVQVDTDTLEVILGLIADRPLLRSPWVELDEEAWRAAGDPAQVITQYALGNDTIEAIAGTSPTGIVRLDADAVPETLGLLRTVGASAVIVTDGQLRRSTRDLTQGQPFQLVDDNGVAITALRIDADLHSTLDDADPELGGYRAVAELALSAMSAADESGVVLDLDEIDPTALDVFLAGVASRDELSTTDVGELLELDLARSTNGSLVRDELLGTVPPRDVTDLSTELRATATSVDTLASMVAPELDSVTILRTQLMAAASSDLALADARAYISAVFDQVLTGTSGLEVAPSDRITLTDRRTDLPLTVINNQPLPINVEIVLSAEKLRFPEGSLLERRLQPGRTEVVIPVETLASGDARVTVTITSPGGLFELGSGTVDIRSTAISGLGLIISIVALLVLGAWWIRTILRIRRTRGAATVAASTEGES